MSELLIGLIGVIAGFTLSEGATYLRCWTTEKKQIRSTRTMLRLEVRADLGLLDALWKRITDEHPGPGVVEVIRCNRLIQLPFPAFSSEGFKGHGPLLTSALSEDEITALYEFHASLDQLQDLRSIAAELSRQEDENLRLASGGTNTVHCDAKKGWGLPAAPYCEKAPALWSEMKIIVEPLLDRGNPIT